MDKEALDALFDKYIRKLRITPEWDVKLELVEDPTWNKTGDFKIDCDDRKAILLLNVVNPKQENPEEVIVHELMHIKMYPLDQVTESLIRNCFEEGSAASKFAYQQFFTALEQTVEFLCSRIWINDDVACVEGSVYTGGKLCVIRFAEKAEDIVAGIATEEEKVWKLRMSRGYEICVSLRLLKRIGWFEVRRCDIDRSVQ